MSLDDTDDAELDRYCCVGFFFGKPHQAITASHCLGEEVKVGEAELAGGGGG